MHGMLIKYSYNKHTTHIVYHLIAFPLTVRDITLFHHIVLISCVIFSMIFIEIISHYYSHDKSNVSVPFYSFKTTSTKLAS